MVNSDIIPNLKEATVAIGTWDRELGPRTIIGTGFLIDPDGYVVTASHVIFDSIKSQKKLLDEEIKTEIATFGYSPNGDNVTYHYSRVEETCNLSLDPLVNEGKSTSWDVMVCKLAKPKQKRAFLKIHTQAKARVWDEIFMCGYPGGAASHNIEKNPVETRVSPLLQYGHISGLMPHDCFSKPQGIQTDIISTGGSSGSPIVNANDGTVIAIAQRVIGGIAFTPTGKGVVNTGMVYGTSYNILKGFIEIVNGWKEGKKLQRNVKTSMGVLKSITKL